MAWVPHSLRTLSESSAAFICIGVGHKHTCVVCRASAGGIRWQSAAREPQTASENESGQKQQPGTSSVSSPPNKSSWINGKVNDALHYVGFDVLMCVDYAVSYSLWSLVVRRILAGALCIHCN